MNTEIKILELQKQQKEISLKHYSRRLSKYLSANQRVHNAISQDDIDELVFQIENLKIEIDIIKSKIEQLNAS